MVIPLCMVIKPTSMVHEQTEISRELMGFVKGAASRGGKPILASEIQQAFASRGMTIDDVVGIDGTGFVETGNGDYELESCNSHRRTPNGETISEEYWDLRLDPESKRSNLATMGRMARKNFVHINSEDGLKLNLTPVAAQEYCDSRQSLPGRSPERPPRGGDLGIFMEKYK